MPSAWYSSSPSDSIQLTVLWRVLPQFEFWIQNDELWRLFITWRAIECRLQIAIGTSNFETTVSYYNVHVFSWLCTYCITDSAHVWLTYNIQVLCKQNLWYFITITLHMAKCHLMNTDFVEICTYHIVLACIPVVPEYMSCSIVLLITHFCDLYHSCDTPQSKAAMKGVFYWRC